MLCWASISLASPMSDRAGQSSMRRVRLKISEHEARSDSELLRKWEGL